MTVKKKIPKACYKKLIMKQKLIKLSALKFISSKTAKGITDGENLVVSSRNHMAYGKQRAWLQNIPPNNKSRHS